MKVLDHSKTSQIDELKNLYLSGHNRLTRLEALQEGKKTAGQFEPKFAEVINKMKLVQKHILLLEDVQEGEICKKRLCIKYKELGVDYIKELHSQGISWKYTLLLLENYEEKMNKEFSWALQNFESFGDHVFARPFRTRIHLLVIKLNYRSKF